MNRRRKTIIILGLVTLVGWIVAGQFGPQNQVEAVQPPTGELATATFAGGCFWCVEASFEKLDGVREVVSGYTGGHTVDPTYEQVCSHSTGHLEAVQIRFDPMKITYNDLLEVFWRQIDPTDDGGQFADRGSSYLSAIFVHDDTQRMMANESLEKLEASGRFEESIATSIRDASDFYAAEEYHQDYYKTHSVRYKSYRFLSGRDQFIKKAWGEDRHYKPASTMMAKMKPTKAELKKSLTNLQYYVTQEDGTEPSFINDYWNNKEPGVYVDIVSGEPLFSSTDKFDSGTGWPSFSQAIEPDSIVVKIDRRLFVPRTEVRSRNADSHLGHVFSDGPAPSGKRYCINSASLRFVPADQLEENDLGRFAQLFATDDEPPKESTADNGQNGNLDRAG